MKIKFLITLFFFLIQTINHAQQQSNLIGTWKLKTVLDSSGKKCKGIKKYTLTINADTSYKMDLGGTSGVVGHWSVDGNKIKFEANTVVDPCMEWSFDDEFKSFEITDAGALIIDFFICGEVAGRSYFEKVKP
jgi:hypothetical protein